jgi:hypothetical protein
MVYDMNISELQEEETYLIEAFRKLTPEARYIVLNKARAVLNREKQGPEQIEPPIPVGSSVV